MFKLDKTILTQSAFTTCIYLVVHQFLPMVWSWAPMPTWPVKIQMALTFFVMFYLLLALRKKWQS